MEVVIDVHAPLGVRSNNVADFRYIYVVYTGSYPIHLRLMTRCSRSSTNTLGIGTHGSLRTRWLGFVSTMHHLRELQLAEVQGVMALEDVDRGLEDERGGGVGGVSMEL